MIKVKQFFSVALIMAMLVSCNSIKDKNAKVGEKNISETSNSSKNEANAIIGYTNDVVDVLKEYNEAALETVKAYYKIEDAMDKKEKDIFLYTGVKMTILFSTDQKAAKAFATPEPALGSNRDFFADSLSKYKKLFTEFKEQNSALELYMKGKDYLDDDYAKGKAIIQKQYDLYDQLRLVKSAVNDKIETIADEAEEIALKDDPMREAFVSAKQDLKKAKDLARTINSIENYTDNDVAKIDAAYNDLTASIEAHKKIDRAALIKGNKNDAYDRYYTSMTNEITSLKAHIRDIKQNKKLENNDYESVNRIIKSIVDQYNYWVR